MVLAQRAVMAPNRSQHPTFFAPPGKSARHSGPHYHKVYCSGSEEVTGASKSQVQWRNFPWEIISLIIIRPYQAALHGVFEAGVLTNLELTIWLSQLASELQGLACFCLFKCLLRIQTWGFMLM